MKLTTKAALYDMLIKDYQAMINELELYKNDIEAIPEKPDLLEIKENQSYSHYLAGQCGTYKAMGFAMEVKLAKLKGTLDWYLSQEEKSK